jgi:hypothetical protein
MPVIAKGLTVGKKIIQLVYIAYFYIMFASAMPQAFF